MLVNDVGVTAVITSEVTFYTAVTSLFVALDTALRINTVALYIRVSLCV